MFIKIANEKETILIRKDSIQMVNFYREEEKDFSIQIKYLSEDFNKLIFYEDKKLWQKSCHELEVALGTILDF